MKTTRTLTTLIAVISTFLSQFAFGQAGRENAYGGKEGFVEMDGVKARYLVLAGEEKEKGKPRPVWIGLHGVVGCSEHAMWAWHDAAMAAGAILIAPQGTEGGEDGGGYNRWNFERDSRSFLQMVEEVGKTHSIDPKRVALVGFSHGGSLTFHTLANNPDKFHFAAVIASGLGNSANEEGLKKAAERVPMFYACGEDDKRAASRYPDTLAKINELGFKTTTELLPGVGHDPRPFNKSLVEAFQAAEAKQRDG
ncbi:MAG TPA: prolyl oligopeptidase family serine peptidase [Chthoniobacterales bacterium]|jgi:poly(3-hydroxybutyrate) depolymerase